MGNSCVLNGGSIAVSSTVGVFFGDERADNVVIKGLTFQAQTQYGVFLEGSGQYHLEDCIIQDQQNNGPVYVTSSTGMNVRISRTLIQVRMHHAR